MLELFIDLMVFFLVAFFLLPGITISAVLIFGAIYQKSKHVGLSKEEAQRWNVVS